MRLKDMDNKLTELCRLAYKYDTDKCPQLKHTYTPFYYEFLKDKRESIYKVLEIGIGPYRGRRRGKMGASLRMWRDFFPNAMIFGADIKPNTVFENDRIRTFLCDQRKKEDLDRLIENTGTDIDLLIDDASHELKDQIFACQTLMPILKKDVIYIIEDAVFSKKLLSALGEYKCWVPPISNRGGNNQLVVIRNDENN